MENKLIRRERFDNAKRNLLKASKNKPKEVKLKEFERDADLLGIFNHRVTGEEVNNNLVAPLQDIIIEQNKCITYLYNIADDTYKTIDELDKEYIAGIQGTVEAAAVASKQAKEASEQARKASNEANTASNKALSASIQARKAQEDLKRTIDALQQTVDFLNEFKDEVNEKLNNLKHLSDVDTTWQAVENIQNTVDFLNKFKDEVNEKLNNLKHLSDVDTTWQAVEKHEKAVKIAYGIAGASLVLSIIQLVLQLIGIL